MMARLPKVLICAYIVDRDDVSEAQMAYEWISRLSQHIDLIVVTAGSRMHETCGLEGNSRIQLEIVKPRVSFQRWDAFDRFAHPGYVDFFLAARKRIRSLMMRQSIALAHHLTPQALRYPSPLAGLGIAFVAGPYHGGLQPPPVMKELQGQEGAFYYLRKLDTLRMRYDPLLRAHFREAKRIVISAPYVLQHLPQYADKCSVIPGTAMNAVEQQTDASRTPMRMMFVGKLEPSKGVELLVNALARVKRSDWTLDIFGEGSQGALYRELSERTGLGQKNLLARVRSERHRARRVSTCASVRVSQLERANWGSVARGHGIGRAGCLCGFGRTRLRNHRFLWSQDRPFYERADGRRSRASNRPVIGFAKAETTTGKPGSATISK